MVTEISIRTRDQSQLVDVTGEVRKVVSESGMVSGVLTVFVPHTTAGVTINENADPSVRSDVLRGLSEVAPREQGFYRHAEGNSDAHIKASLIGASLQVIVQGGRLMLGTWQGIYFAEFDGPRTRRLYIKLQPD